MKEERGRVLAMLEAGKITAAEADELIDALQSRARRRPHGTYGGRLRMLPASWVVALARWLAAAAVTAARLLAGARMTLGRWQTGGARHHRR